MTATQIRRATDLTAPQKAAALIIALGAKEASRLMGYLDPAEVEILAAEVAKLRRLPASVVGEIVREFRDASVAEAGTLHGGIDVARHLLGEINSGYAEEIARRIADDDSASPFEFLDRLDPAEIVGHLRHEHPQTIAVVLAHLGAQQAARVLSGLEAAARGDVALRIASMDRIPPSAIRRIADALRGRVSSAPRTAESAARGGAKELAAILNSGDRTTEKSVLEALAGTDAALADRVRALMFVFEDIAQMRDRDIQEVLRAVDAATLALAVKGIAEDVRECVLRNLSERARESLLEEIDALGAVRIEDVEQARAAVVAAARSLDADGKITMRAEDGGLVE